MGVPLLWPVLQRVLGSCDVTTASPVACDVIVMDCNLIFHQCLYHHQSMATFPQHVAYTLTKKLRCLFRHTGGLRPVYFVFDGIAGRMKEAVQRKRRQKNPTKWHFSPCTVTMLYMERIIQQVCATLGVPEAYLSDAFTNGEGDHKLFQFPSAMASWKNVLVVSRDNDLVFLSLLRMSDFHHIYIYNDTASVIHVNQLAAALIQRSIDLRLFVLAFFVFGNDYSPAVCSLTEANVTKLMTFLTGKTMDSAGLCLTPARGSHTWTIGTSIRVRRASGCLYKHFFTLLLEQVPPKRTVKGPIPFKPFVWNFKYYCGDPYTNLSRMDKHISHTRKNTKALNPTNYHRRQQTSHLHVPTLPQEIYVKRLY